MKQARGFGIIEVVVVVIVLALIGGGAFLWYTQGQATDGSNPTPTVTPSATPTPTPTPDPTAGWKTYSNPQQKYALKYPPTWTAEPAGENQLNVVGDQGRFILNFGGLGIGLDSSSADSSKDITLNVGGEEIEAVEYTWNSSSGASMFIAFEVTRGGSRYGFRLSADSGANVAAVRQTLLQILATVDLP